MEPRSIIEEPLILLVDDDIRTARLLARLLEDDGFRVELATDGAFAIARLARTPVPDILVTDFRMPHADGIAVARFARSLRPDLPLFVLTGYPELVARLGRGLVPEAVVHTKPVDYTALSAELRSSVEAVSSSAARAQPSAAAPGPLPSPIPA
ncbi:response regulator [Sorangium sp. So ce887]|uniref:response regulator n=1 Tax=Sorangium sp. So ce887 TaxID=3133324 RepID=UPI003F5DAE2E